MVFDLDGTLVDSEPNYRVVDEQYLRAKGIELSDDEWKEVVGMGGGPFIDLLRSRFGIEGTTADLIAEKDDLYLEYAVGRTRTFPTITELVRYLFVHGYNLAVGTASRRRVLDHVLEETGLFSYFDATVGSDEVEHSKPAPDIFLEASRRLSVAPDRCLVVEDSQYGVEAAGRAGMRVVALPAAGTEGKERFSRADLVFPGGASQLSVEAVVKRFGLHSPRATREPGARLDPAVVERFRRVVWDFYEGSHRPMPWRETKDPYRIMVSEFMLQQTQVSRVEPKYRVFVEEFPTVQVLADASLQEVLSHWQGLGYNRRGRNLRDAARMVVKEFGATVPADLEALQSLPGVGAYTASAIAAFAFERPVVVLETNIRRLFLHYFFPGVDRVPDLSLEPLISQTRDEDVRHWYYALMDYGSMLGRIFPNANRRSSHYAKQSRFAGSIREVRGQIIRELSARTQLTIEDLERSIGPTDARLVPAIDGLVRDGMIEFEGNRIRLR